VLLFNLLTTVWLANYRAGFRADDNRSVKIRPLTLSKKPLGVATGYRIADPE